MIWIGIRFTTCQTNVILPAIVNNKDFDPSSFFLILITSCQKYFIIAPHRILVPLGV